MPPNSAIAQKKTNYILQSMSPELDISVGAIPLQKYCIASSPRSGSTLISRMLLSSNLAGDPKEYLGAGLLQAWSKINGSKVSIKDYIKEMETRRTSKNGVFGIKIHGRQLLGLSKKISSKHIYSIIENFDKFIFVTRKDKINQAISYHIAKSTGVWHFDQEEWLDEFDIPEPNFDAGRILNHLSDFLREEKIWENIFKNTKKPVYKIYYEDLIADYESKSKEIFDFLGINISVVPQIPTQQMKKSFTSEYRNLLLKKIGLDAT